MGLGLILRVNLAAKLVTQSPCHLAYQVCPACIQATDGAHESLASLKEGPVHDVAWSPTGSHFMVVAGFMPAKTVLFDAKCAGRSRAQGIAPVLEPPPRQRTQEPYAVGVVAELGLFETAPIVCGWQVIMAGGHLPCSKATLGGAMPRLSSNPRMMARSRHHGCDWCLLDDNT